MDSESTPSIDALDSNRSLDVEHAWLALKEQGCTLMPGFRQAYGRFKTASGRVALIFYATQYARVNDNSFYLGVAALSDGSKLVRNRACGLLAYSLRYDAVPYLSALLTDADSAVRESASAAITAIKKQNHHIFADRTGSGRVQWIVNEEDKLTLS